MPAAGSCLEGGTVPLLDVWLDCSSSVWALRSTSSKKSLEAQQHHVS